MGRPKEIVCSWSGGIDSTGVVVWLLRQGWRVHLTTIGIYGGSFGKRESLARAALKPHLEAIALQCGGEIVDHQHVDGAWLWAFSPDGVEIPRRNKHIIDHLITAHAMPLGIKNVGMGEYIGADTWLVKDHVAGADADHRSLSAYIYNEYGLDYRLVSLQDFGESRYKSDRLLLLMTGLGDNGDKLAHLTSNCLYDHDQHCGACYKCIERAAAFATLSVMDRTLYEVEPEGHPTYKQYLAQMQGADVDASFKSFVAPEMPSV